MKLGISFVTLWALMFCSIQFNFLDLPVKVNGQKGSEDYVVRKMEAAAGLRQDTKGGFMIYSAQFVDDYGYAYRPNPGWQAIGLYYFVKLTGTSVASTVEIFNTIYSVLLSLSISLFIFLLFWAFGLFPALLSAISFLFSTPLIFLGANLYWCIFISMGMVGVIWFMLQSKDSFSPEKLKHLYLVQMALIFLKSMTGYEWITFVTLNAFVPVTYFAYVYRERWTVYFSTIFKLWVASIFGFMAALSIHILQGLYAYGSFSEAFGPIIARAVAHSHGGAAIAKKFHAINPAHFKGDMSLGIMLEHYFSAPILHTPEWLGAFSVNTKSAVIAMFAAYLSMHLVSKFCIGINSGTLRKVNGIFFATIVALLSALSWVVLAKNHSQYHIFINIILFCFIFMPMLAATIALCFRTLFAEIVRKMKVDI